MAERGPVVLREEDLDFAFDDGWAVCSQWDKESVYKALMGQVSESKGVDFVGLRDGPNGELFLIEVKDYRTSERTASTREKVDNGGAVLADIVAAKVRDTVAGLVGAARTERSAGWDACLKPLTERGVWVVLWIEHAGLDPRSSSPVQKKRAKVGAVTLLDNLKRRCRWLSARVAVCSRDGGEVPGLTVRSIAGAARTRGRQP